MGFSVFSYEGIGTVLPIGEITKYPEDFKKITLLVVLTACIMFLFVGLFCCTAWGDEITTPIITDNLGTY